MRRVAGWETADSIECILGSLSVTSSFDLACIVLELRCI